MSAALAARNPEQRLWLGAGAGAAAGHALLLVLALGLVRHASAPPPEPVVLVELPPMEAPVATASPEPTPTPAPAQPVAAETPVRAPRTEAPLPADIVPLPAPRPEQPATATPEPAPATTQAAAPAAVAAPAYAPGADDPRARRQEMDYFRTLSAHLNRRKTYPAEARQARQQGVVTVRFTVDRAGNVSAVSIRQSSGHTILDDATLALMQRVAPLPPMPASMQRDHITLSLPIDYSLRTS